MLKPSLAAVLLSIVLPCVAAPARHAPPGAALAPACAAGQGRLDEKGYVAIGGIEQWVTIKGESCANPVILVVHGGPGNPLSLYSDRMYGPWTRDFTVVQWDQRGSGMTYGRSRPAPDAPLTLEQLTRDGVELAGYLARRLGKRQVILFGSSWGSILSVYMLKADPGLFAAYLGASQVVGYRQNQPVGYARLLERARGAGDAASLQVLEAVGPPPWTDPRSFGKVRRVIRKYEEAVTTPSPEDWWQAAPEYATPQAKADYDAGEDYSFLYFVGRHGDGMFSQVDLPAMGVGFPMPVFLVQGEEDLLTTPEVTRRYYDSLRAPFKALVMVPGAGHDPNQAMVDAQYRVLKERILPLLR
ncbi:alpha/beta fold hydrolase [Oxalobacteraceae bacterium A2-2]